MQPIETKGLKETQNLLLKLDDRLKNTKPLMAEIANHIFNTTEDSFEKEQTPDGKKWSPIKPRKTDRHPEKILYDSGNMQKRLYKKVSKDSLTVGINAVSKKGGFAYPLTHQFGTNKAGRKRNITIVARPFMPIHKSGEIYKQTQEEIFELIDEYTKAILK